MIDDLELQSLTNQMYTITEELVAAGNSPFALAAVHVMIALQIYKTSLSEEEYNLMVDAISINRDKVKPLAEAGSVH